MTNASFQKFFAAASLSALAIVTAVGCSSNSGSVSPSKAASKPTEFKPLVSIQMGEGDMKVDGGALPMNVRQYSIVDDSRIFSVSLNDSAEGSTVNTTKDGVDYRVSDSCEGDNCGEIVMTMTRKTGDHYDSRAYLFIKSGEGKYSQTCTLLGLAADPNIAIAGLMSRCDHDVASGPKAASASALSNKDAAPTPAPTPASK